MVGATSTAKARVVARVQELAREYTPPDFGHVPDADAALFLCAIDHKSGYEHAHKVDDDGAFAGSELMWLLGLRAARAEPGLLTAERLRDVTGAEVAAWFQTGDETVADPERRASLWRDLAAGLERDHDGRTVAMLGACGGQLGGAGGLVALLARYEAYSDPLAKKAFLFAKIAERRGWLSVRDPHNWQVAADNVLMRLALRSGLVAPGELDEVRSATRDAFRDLADRSGLSPPVLDDMLWELGRDDPDLLGHSAGDLREPERDPDSAWY